MNAKAFGVCCSPRNLLHLSLKHTLEFDDIPAAEPAEASPIPGRVVMDWEREDACESSGLLMLEGIRPAAALGPRLWSRRWRAVAKRSMITNIKVEVGGGGGWDGEEGRANQVLSYSSVARIWKRKREEEEEEKSINRT